MRHTTPLEDKSLASPSRSVLPSSCSGHARPDPNSPFYVDDVTRIIMVRERRSDEPECRIEVLMQFLAAELNFAS